MEYWLELLVNNVCEEGANSSGPNSLNMPQEQSMLLNNASNVISVKNLVLAQTQEGFMMKSDEGVIHLKSGDVIQTNNHHLTVKIIKSQNARKNNSLLSDMSSGCWSHRYEENQSENLLDFLDQNTCLNHGAYSQESLLMYDDMCPEKISSKNQSCISNHDSLNRGLNKEQSFLEKLKYIIWG